MVRPEVDVDVVEIRMVNHFYLFGSGFFIEHDRKRHGIHPVGNRCNLLQAEVAIHRIFGSGVPAQKMQDVHGDFLSRKNTTIL